MLLEEIVGKKPGPVLDLVTRTAPCETLRSICEDDDADEVEGAFGAIAELDGATGGPMSISIADNMRLPLLLLPLDLLSLLSLLLPCEDAWQLRLARCEMRGACGSSWVLLPHRELERDTDGDASSPLSSLWNCTPRASYPLLMLEPRTASFERAVSDESAASIANAMDASLPASRMA